ncbi:unnamed protein product [Rodentolepis nana]|uniref:DUF4817 domain-containing protein n=1 Tax=Rodentolepis nana TaxID=102285 RepID=A0A0R3U0T7_RODNA|nr:unnamed protein product [Rodentolepis nana]
MATTDLVAFTSPNSKPLAEMKEVVNVYEDRIFRRTKHNSKKLTIQTNLCPDVAILRLFPSISVEAVRSFFKPPMKELSEYEARGGCIYYCLVISKLHTLTRMGGGANPVNFIVTWSLNFA